MRLTLLYIFVFIALFPLDAFSYVGPGLGLGALGVVLGIIVSIFLSVFGLFWYPIKRLIKRLRKPMKRED